MFSKRIPTSLPATAAAVITAKAGDFGDDALVRTMADGLGGMDEAWRTIVKARTANLKNLMETRPRNLANAHAFAAKAAKQATDAATRAMRLADAEIDAQMKEIMRPLNKAVDGPRAGEVRAYARSLSATHRSEFIMEAINAGDVTTASALLIANPQLSGLNRQSQGHYLELWKRKQHGQTMARIDVLKWGIDAMQRGGTVFNNAVVNLQADPEVKRAELTAAAAAAASKLPA